jgi:signal transduction histidine kinase
VFAACIMAMLVMNAAAVAVAQQRKTILIIYSDSRIHPAIALFDENFQKTVSARSSQAVEIFTEFLDLYRFGEKEYHDLAAEYLRAKYKYEKLDVVVAGRSAALEFVIRNRSTLFPNVPVVHAGVEAYAIAGMRLPKDVTGAPIVFDAVATTDLAFRLHANARKVVLITGSAAPDLWWATELNRQLQPIAGRVAIDHWSGLRMTDLLKRLASLSDSTVVLTPGIFKDGDGRTFTPADSISQMSRASKAPIYGFVSTQMGTGLVGGAMIAIDGVGQQAAEIVLRVLSGASPGASIVPPADRVHMLDWRQLKRWGVREADLPSGSRVLYREPTFWEQYFWYGIAAIVALLLQTALIICLFVERRTRMRVEAGLRESEERMHLAANAANLSFWRWDIGSGRIWASAGNGSSVGLEAGRPITMPELMQRVHADDRGAIGRAIDAAIKGSEILDHELRVADGRGNLRWATLRGRVAFSKNGQPTEMLGVAIDISARKDAERKILEQRDELAHLSRVGALGQLSGALAHELAQPLTAILSNAQAAQRYLADGRPNLDELREILADIVSDDERAGEVIRRLRALLKNGETQQQPIELNSVVHDVRRVVKSDLVTRNVSLDCQLSPGLPLVKADPIQLQQVLLNVIVNACDAMTSVDSRDRFVSITTAASEAGGVNLTIRDRGPGIDPMMLDRIFQPFVTSKTSGIGLGLSISRSIIEAHGGRIWAENDPGRGAAFHITLPAQRVHAP